MGAVLFCLLFFFFFFFFLTSPSSGEVFLFVSETDPSWTSFLCSSSKLPAVSSGVLVVSSLEGNSIGLRVRGVSSPYVWRTAQKHIITDSYLWFHSRKDTKKVSFCTVILQECLANVLFQNPHPSGNSSLGSYIPLKILSPWNYVSHHQFVQRNVLWFLYL